MKVKSEGSTGHGGKVHRAELHTILLRDSIAKQEKRWMRETRRKERGPRMHSTTRELMERWKRAGAVAVEYPVLDVATPLSKWSRFVAWIRRLFGG